VKELECASNKWNAGEIVRSPIETPDYAVDAPLIEAKFSVPLFVGTNASFILQGTIDRLTKIRNGCFTVEDFKTHAGADHEGFFKEHRMSPQGKTYVWVLRQLAAMTPGGFFDSLIGSGKIGFAIKGVFVSPKEATQFVKSDIMFYEDSELEEYYQLLIGLCMKLDAAIGNKDALPPAEGAFNCTCKTAFGKFCPYIDACSNSAKVGRAGVEMILSSRMKPKPYLPLNFGGGQSKTYEN